MTETKPGPEGTSESFLRDSEAYLGLITNKTKKEFWRQRGWVGVYAAVVLAAAWTWASFQTPLYQSTATVLIDPKAISDPAERKSLENLPMQAAMITSQILLEKIVAKPEIQGLPFFEESEDPTEKLSRGLEVKSNSKNNTITIKFSFQDAQIAADIANSVAQVYVQSQASRGSDDAKEKADYFQKELADNTEKRKKIREEMSAIVKKSPRIQDEKTGSAQISFFEKELAKLDSEIISDKTFFAGYQEFIKQGGSEESNALMRSRPEIMRRDEEVQQARLALSILKQKFRDQHPDVVAAQMRVNLLEAKLKTDRELVLSEMQANLKAKGTMRKNLQEQLDALRTKASEINPDQTRYKQLLQDEKDALDRAKTLNLKLAEISGKIEQSSPGVEILAAASAARAPFFPDLRKTIFLALLFAFATSWGGIFLRYYLDGTLHNLEDLEVFIHKPHVGQIPMLRVGKEGFTPVFSKDEELLRFKNNMNFICANVRFLTEAESAKIFLITSAIMGEGKSFTTYHLAQAFAADPKKVIVIDADFCHASLSQVFSEAHAEFCLDSYVMGQATFEQIIQKTTNPNIDFIAAGHIRKSAPNVFRSRQMKDLLAHLREKYEIILIDGAPILQVNDSLALGELVDLRLLIIASGSTHRDLVIKAVNKIAPGKLVNAGVLLNRVRGFGGTYGYYPYPYGGIV